jgi:hypothetical protein
MAGDEAKRPDYLKSLVTSNVIGNSKSSMAANISSGYLKGPGIRFRHFPDWAKRTGYSDTVGLVSGTIEVGNQLDQKVLIEEIDHAVGETVQLQTSSVGWADFTYWAEQYMLTNHPELFTSDWVADYSANTGKITITYEDSTESTFTPDDFDPNARYLYASYSLTKEGTPGPVITGTTIFLGSTESFPSLTGWTIDGSTWVKTTYKGQGDVGDYTYSTKEIQHRSLSPKWYRIDTQKIVHKVWSPLKYFIYKFESGNTNLDELFSGTKDMGEFFPFIPIRLDNQFVSDTYYPDVYAGAKKALKKVTTGKLDDIIEKVSDNASLGDIDYAYTVFGVSLNVKDNSCKKYLYQFFKTLLEAQPVSDALGDWEIKMAEAKASLEAWTAWKNAQGEHGSSSFSSPEPVVKPYPPFPDYKVQITSGNRPVMNYDMLIHWAGIKEETGYGHKKPDAKQGDLWFEVSGTDTYDMTAYGIETDRAGLITSVTSITVEHITLYWQDTDNTWKSLKISGLKHRNLIYGGKAVEINAVEALGDTSESGFIVPLHAGIYKSMSLIDSTQVSTACCFIVFNCYQEFKQKWYQTGLFKVIVFVVQAYFYGLPTALATLVATKVIEKVAVEIFGEKNAALIVAIVNVILIVNGQINADASSAANFSNMMKAENLLKLTQAVGNGVSAYLRASTMEVLADTQAMLQSYKGKMDEVQRLFEQNIGYGQGLIDPMKLTDSSHITLESSDKFLGRTLMTGSEIAELSMNMLSRFSELTLTTDLPT